MPVANLTGTVVAIVAGGARSLALKSDGTVWEWGAWAGAQVLVGSNLPVPVTSLTQVTAIATSGAHVLVLKSDQTVWGWGYGSNSPVQVTSLTGVLGIAAGSWHSLALKSDHTVWAWGTNYYGQLGNGTNNDSNLPVLVSGLTDVAAVSAQGVHSLALKSDHTLMAWGSGGYGALGNGTSADSNVPVAVNTLTGVTTFAVGTNHTLAVKSDGTVWAWGYNEWGTLGNGTSWYRNMPVAVTGLTGIVSVDASEGLWDWESFRSHSLALTSDGKVWAWGNGSEGQFGNGTRNRSDVSVPVSNLTGAVAIAAGGRHSVALEGDGTVWAWGWNRLGQLGDGSNTDSTVPVAVHNLTEAVAVAAGGAHSLALERDGAVWAWGYNQSGQLGNGGNTHANLPVRVTNLGGVVAIAAGDSHSLALKSDGTVWAWGWNPDGQLGNGATAGSNVPVQVSNLTKVVTIAAGGGQSMAVDTDGTAWAWGEGYATLPAPVSSLPGAVALAIGSWHSLALMKDGAVVAWGSNEYGQLGNGSYTSSNVPASNVPAPVSNLTGAVAIGAGITHSLAVLAIGIPVLTLDPAAIIFGNQAIGADSAPRLITLFNGGAAPLRIHSVTLTGMHSNEFSVADTCGGTTVAAGDTCAFNVRFRPLTAGSSNAALLVTSNAPGSAHLVTLGGTGMALPGVPANPSPANNATGVSLTLTLTWTGGSGATSHDVYFGTVSPPPFITNTTTANYSPGTLTADTTYYWKCVAKNGAGETSSATWSFRTVAGPGAPSNPAPAHGATSVRLDTTLSWTGGSGATSHDVYFGATSPPPFVTNTTSGTYKPGALNRNTTYYWKCVAKNSGGETSSSLWRFTTDVGPPLIAPTLLSPAHRATNVSLTPRFTWTPVTKAELYHVVMIESTSDLRALVRAVDTPNPYLEVWRYSWAFATGSVVRWHVTTIRSGWGYGEASPDWIFWTQLNPNAPASPSPANGAASVSQTPTLTWNAAAGATSYDVFVSTSNSVGPLATASVASSNSIGVHTIVGHTSKTAFKPGKLRAKTKYYWRTVAKSKTGEKASATWWFKTR
ncbi:MAG: choice-of-anchor D domain-containing protein [Bryobacteraceae bacterium]|nr:choice-of-anchor D domain-containing protein [Bryobacteraceae bacterium]